MNSASDIALLARWRNRRDADAFAELVARYGPLVYSACLRVLRDAAAAEDAAQDCFIELLRSGARVRSLPAWLHVMATRRALDRLKADRRRMDREMAYAAQQPGAVTPTWDDVSACVDEAIQQLPNKLREPVVQRFLQGRTYAEISRDLELPITTIQYRLNQGIDRVRQALGRRGIVVTASALAAMLLSAPASALPVSAAAHVGRMALAGPGAGFATSAGAMHASAWIGGGLAVKKLVAVIVVSMGALFAGNYVLNDYPSHSVAGADVQTGILEDASAQERDAPRVSGTERQTAEAAVDAVTTTSGGGPVVVSGIVVDNRGRGIAGAAIDTVWTGHSDSIVADENGRFRILFPTDFASDGPLVFRREVEVDGKLLSVIFRGDVLGDSLTGTVEASASHGTVSGTRVGSGRGAAGTWETSLTLGDRKIAGTLSIATDSAGVATGEWRDEYAPATLHDLGAPESIRLSAALEGLKSLPQDFEIPPSGRDDIVIRLERTATVSGMVVDSAGTTLAEWTVYAKADGRYEEDVTDASGVFTIAGIYPGTYDLVADDPGNNVRTEAVVGTTLGAGQHLRDVELVWQLGRSLSGQVVDDLSAPVAGARVSARLPHELEMESGPPSAQTDSTGRFTLAQIPDAVTEMDLNAWHEGYMSASHHGVRVDAGGHTLVLTRQPKIEGRVVDVGTGEPVTRYRLFSWINDIQELSEYLRITGRMELEEHIDGVFSLTSDGYGDIEIGVSSPGYLTTHVSVPDVAPGASIAGIEVRLQASTPIQGIVVDELGKGVSGARIYLGYPTELDVDTPGSDGVTQSDSGGHFIITEHPGSLSLVSVYHPDYAMAWEPVQTANAPIRITLLQGATVEGTVTYGGQALEDGRAAVCVYADDNAQIMQVATGDGGAYRTEKAPAEPIELTVGFHEGGLRRYLKRTVHPKDGESLRENFDFSDTYDSYVEGVLLLDDAPIPLALLRAIVEFDNGDRAYYQEETRADGTYTLGPLPATTFEFGALWVMLENGSYLAPEYESVTTRPGETTRHEIRLSNR